CFDIGVEVANINSPGQIVISGDVKKIEEAAKVAAERGAKRAIILEVSGAFHSSFMKEASVKLAKELESITLNTPKINFLSNVTAKPAESAREIKDNLIKQVYSSVLWEDSMNFILSKGVSNFFEFGPGKVLKGLMRRISDKAQVTVIEKEEDLLNRRQNAS
ncbi:ACP S-malonyltransferase, partial [bacterium]